MQRQTIGAAIILVFLFAPVAFAQEQSASPREGITLWHEAKALFPTQLLLPSNFNSDKAHTLVLALHGWGSTAEAFQSIGEPFANNGYMFAVPESAYPFLVENEKLGFDWSLYHTGDGGLQQRAALLLVLDHLPAVVKDLQQRYQVEKVYALGFSQGASIAFLVGIYNSELFDGIISFGLPDLEADWFQGDALANGRDIQVLMLHGKEDELAPIAESKQARDLLTGNGYNVTFRTFEGGHTIPGAELDFVMSWIQE